MLRLLEFGEHSVSSPILAIIVYVLSLEVYISFGGIYHIAALKQDF